MYGLVYHPFHFVEKIILNTLGRIAGSYEFYGGKENFSLIPTVFALEGSIEKKLFYDGMILLLLLNGTKSRENNGPNGQPAPAMIPSEFYKNRYIQRYRPAANRPFPSSKKSHFQNEAKCETFVVKMSFICMIIKNNFHINGLALSLTLKVRFFRTRKWPIGFCVYVSVVVRRFATGDVFVYLQY